MDEAKREIQSALTTDEGGAQAALRVLGWALRWSAEAIRQVDGGAGGTSALETIFAFDDALARSAELGATLPHLVAAARPGGTLPEHLARRTSELAAEAERVSACREELEKLTAGEEQLRARLTEHEQLRQRVDELRRLERLVVALDSLRDQQEAIDERLRSLRGRDVGIDETLRISGDTLVQLSKDQLELLAPQTREALAGADEAQRTLAAEQRKLNEGAAQLAKAGDLLEQIRAERGAQLAGLRRYAQATRDVARALAEFGGASGSGTELSLMDVAAAADRIENRLRDVDNVLRSALAERDAAETDGRQILSRTGD
ncbi:hypothetical protein [Streptomyces sp. NPDC001530]|uniref:hypothetical protein n=1 Tax=Streptomyces sp. NPDC001530 TaxID=3364582 RepID=UPI00369C07AD